MLARRKGKSRKACSPSPACLGRARTSSRIFFQMMRVISSPSSSTTGLATWILASASRMAADVAKAAGRRGRCAGQSWYLNGGRCATSTAAAVCAELRRQRKETSDRLSPLLSAGGSRASREAERRMRTYRARMPSRRAGATGLRARAGVQRQAWQKTYGRWARCEGRAKQEVEVRGRRARRFRPAESQLVRRPEEAIAPSRPKRPTAAAQESRKSGLSLTSLYSP